MKNIKNFILGGLPNLTCSKMKWVLKFGGSVLFVFILLLHAKGCSTKVEKEQVLVKINDSHITQAEFENQLTAEIEFEPDFKLTQEAKTQFLDQLIKKELLIQEAIRLKLDRQKQFIKAIERYWQSTLIRDLLALKGEEVSKRTYISEEEIHRRYQLMLREDKSFPPLSEIRGKIEESLKEEKKTEKIKEWINNLRNNAKIEINQELINK
jgi:hypothetical protein